MAERVLVPIDPPKSIPGPGEDYDDVLFELCRDDDYHGLYREFIKRAREKNGA